MHPIKYKSQNGTEVWTTPDGYIQSITLDWYEDGGCVECDTHMDSQRIDIYGQRVVTFSWVCSKCGHHEIEMEEEGGMVDLATGTWGPRVPELEPDEE